jgi:hypothetical protein
MTFTGTPVIKEVSDGLVRITGVSLANEATGTIGLHEKTVAPDIRLPAAFQPREYTYGNGAGADVTLQDSVQVWFEYIAPGAVVPPISVVKTGVDPRDFAITLENLTESESPTDSGLLEIYVRFH